MNEESSQHTPGAPVPGGVYLCQVDGGLSCGACCGLYNLPGIDETSLCRILERRTGAFARTPRQIEAIAGFGEKESERLGSRRPIDDFHHCPFVGLIGDARDRVGCLLHPLAEGNGGVDYRGLSHYGGMACRIYFCPSHDSLTPAWKKIVRQAAGSWYLYGLVVTEDELLGAFFRTVEERLGRSLTEKDAAGGTGAAAALRTFFGLKCDWPHRPGDIPGPVNYFFKDRERTRPPVQYPASCSSPSAFDEMFRALGSAFAAEKELRQAEQVISDLVGRVVEGIRSRI